MPRTGVGCPARGQPPLQGLLLDGGGESVASSSLQPDGEASSRASPRKLGSQEWAWLWRRAERGTPTDEGVQIWGKVSGRARCCFPHDWKSPQGHNLRVRVPLFPLIPPPSNPKEGQTNLGAKLKPGFASACCALRAVRKKLGKLSAALRHRLTTQRSGPWKWNLTLETQPALLRRESFQNPPFNVNWTSGR